MGSGDLVGSKFHLTVSLRYAPEPGEMDFLCDLFNRTSQILSDATDGTLSIGTVEIATHSGASHRADIWIHPLEDVAPNSQTARLWLRGSSMDISQRYLIHPTLLAHELGHYLFGLGDEYDNDDPDIHCRDDIDAQASLMEWYGWGNLSSWVDSFGTPFITWPLFLPVYANGDAEFRTGQPTEFCSAGRHGANANPQNTRWSGRSCWQVIADDATHNGIPYGLTEPPATGPRKRKPKAAAPPTCVELLSVERSLLQVAPGMSLRRDAALQAATAFWVDAARAGEQFRVNTGRGEGLIGAPIETVPADPDRRAEWRAGQRELLYEPRAERRARADEFVRGSLVEITRGGRAARQQIVLVSAVVGEGEVDTLLGLLPDVRAAGVRLDVVTVPDDADLGVLAETALVTGGRLLVTGRDGGATSPEAASALMALAGESRDNGATISVDDVRGPRPRRGFPRGETTFEVQVTEGSSLATIGAAWPDSDAPLEVEVRDPAGRLVADSERASVVTGTGRYAFVQVEGPTPGVWTVRVAGGRDTSGVRPIALEVNERVSLDVSLLHAHVRVGEPIELRATLRVPEPVPGAAVVAVVGTPTGDVVRVPFTEHAGARDDPEPAASYTAAIDTSGHGAGAYTIDVHAERVAGEFPAARDRLYAADPGMTPERLKRMIRTPAIRRMTTLTAVADEAGRTSRDPIAGWNPIPG